MLVQVHYRPELKLSKAFISQVITIGLEKKLRLLVAIPCNSNRKRFAWEFLVQSLSAVRHYDKNYSGHIQLTVGFSVGVARLG